MSDHQSVHSIVRNAEANYLQGTTKLGDHVEWSMHDAIEKIIAYLNSKHISGGTDSLGRKKPFFNIVTAAVNIWYRATDIDRKDIVVLPNSSSTVIAAFLANVVLQQWMKKARFGVFLNNWGRTLAQYGGAIIEFVEKGDELTMSVLPWRNTIVDSVDFTALPVIKKFYKTPAQLEKMAQKGNPEYAGYNLEQVKELIEKAQSARKTQSGDSIDQQDDFLEIYEIHGELPLALLKDEKERKDADWDTYRQQMQVVSFVETKKGEYDDFILFRGKEKKSPHIKTALIEEEGRTLPIGAVESLFDAQWMQNHTIKQMKDQLDIASKIVFQTADPRFVDKNILTGFENGNIFHWDKEKGSPLTEVQNVAHDIGSLQVFSDKWKLLSQEITSTPEAVRGTTPPSGVPLGTTQIVTSQGLSLFEIMTENKGLSLEDMLREFVIPFLKKKLKNKDEIAAILQDHEIEKIDAIFVPKEAIRRYNKRVVEEVIAQGEKSLQGGILSPIQPFNPQIEEQAVRQELAPLGNQRFFTPDDVNWDKVLEDLEWNLDINISNEQKDKQAVLTTLNTVLQTIASNPQVLLDPSAKMLFNEILSTTGVFSPAKLSIAKAAPSPMAMEVLAGIK